MYKVPVPDRMKNGIDQIINVLDNKHENGMIYEFDDEARITFNHYHDHYYMPKKQQHGDDDNRRGVLSKSLGYIIRLAGILTAIENASNVVRGA